MLEMVERIARRASGSVMILVTARPELWDRGRTLVESADGFTEVSLRPLTDSQCRKLVQGRPVAAGVPAPLVERVLTRAEGNPYFLEELLFHVALGATSALPDSLSSLLTARLDSLDPIDLSVLQVAAVVGRAFWVEAVERGLPAEPVAQRLTRLESRGFVSRQNSSSLLGQAEFAFRHALMHDAAYESVPRARRARLHADVAEWLEAIVGDRRDEFEDLVAAHWAWAALPEIADLAWEDPERREEVRKRAFKHLLRAGSLARSRFAVGAALGLHQRALTLAEGSYERANALEEIGDDQASVYHGDEADAAYAEALDLIRPAAGHGNDLARLCRKVASTIAFNPGAFRVNPDPARVEALIVEGQEAAADDAERARLLLVEGECARLYRGSEPYGQGSQYDPRPIAERIAAAERAFAMADGLGLHDLRLECRHTLAILHELAGRYGVALELLRRRVEELDATVPPPNRADALRQLAAQIATTTGDFDEALLFARQSLDLSRGSNPHHVMHATFPNLLALFNLGRWDELLVLLEEHVAAFREDPAIASQFVRDGPLIGATTLMLMGRTTAAAELAALVGDPLSDLESASAWQARYEVIAGRPEVAVAIARPKVLEGRTRGPRYADAVIEAEMAMEDWDELTEVLRVARDSAAGNALLEPVCDRAEGALENARGQRQQARRLLGRSLARFDLMGMKYEAARTRELLAAVEPAATRHALRRAARKTYEELGVPVGPTTV
jgi:tetratricopeptide (TPR) repeat protein